MSLLTVGAKGQELTRETALLLLNQKQREAQELCRMMAQFDSDSRWLKVARVFQGVGDRVASLAAMSMQQRARN